MNRKVTWKSTLQALLYLAPMLIMIGVFTVYPIIKSVDMSFYLDFNLFTGAIDGRGLDNYQELFSDPKFYEALRNTAVFVLGVVPASLIISLAIALMLNQIPFLKVFLEPSTFYLT